MDLILETNRIRVVVENCCSVVFVTNIIAIRIIYCIRVAYLRSIVLMRHKYLGMWAREFLGSMPHLITSRRITKHTLLRREVSLDLIIVMLILTWWIILV